MPRLLSRLSNLAARFLRDESGPTAVEYALMLALIFVVCVGAMQTLGSNSKNTFSYIGTQVKSKGS